MRFVLIGLLFIFSYLQSQSPVSGPVAPKISAVQVIVSSKHPDSMDDGSTVIYDNVKGVDNRSLYRPLNITSSNFKDSLTKEKNSINDYKNTELKLIYSLPFYTGSKKQNIFIINALNIQPGWSNDNKWSDGSIVDDNSIVDWIRYGMGINKGIPTTANKSDRGKLFKKLYLKRISKLNKIKTNQ